MLRKAAAHLGFTVEICNCRFAIAQWKSFLGNEVHGASSCYLAKHIKYCMKEAGKDR